MFRETTEKFPQKISAYFGFNNELSHLIEAGADIVMLDTYVKDEKNLFDFLNVSQLSLFIEKANHYNLKTALAGNLRKENIEKLQIISPDIIGIRGAVCEDFDRKTGMIMFEKIIDLKKELIRCFS